jgi:hypothetical protein
VTGASFPNAGFILMPNFISILDIHNVVNAEGLWQIQIQETYFAMKLCCRDGQIFLILDELHVVRSAPDWSAAPFFSSEVGQGGLRPSVRRRRFGRGAGEGG